MSLLDTVEPDFWMMDLDDALTDLSCGVSVRIEHDYPDSYLSCVEVSASLPLYSHCKVESLLAECRKQALLDAQVRWADAHGFDKHGVIEWLRRMAESDKTTMEGEK